MYDLQLVCNGIRSLHGTLQSNAQEATQIVKLKQAEQPLSTIFIIIILNVEVKRNTENGTRFVSIVLQRNAYIIVSIVIHQMQSFCGY